MTAFVTCGQTRAALAAVRALGRARIAVAVGAKEKPALAFWSRYASSTQLLPAPEDEPQNFAIAVGEQVRGRGARLVLFSTNASLWALSRFRDALPHAIQTSLPTHEAVSRSLDRSSLHDLARTLKIPCAPTIRLDARSEIEPAIREAARVGMPALVRPIIAWGAREDGNARADTPLPVTRVADLRRLLRSREDLTAGGCLIEPRAPGRTFAYATWCVGGVPQDEVFQERLRERFTLTGISTLARTVEADEEIRAHAHTLLGALDWTGPANLEFHRGTSGKLHLVSMLGRLWGSLQLSVNAGVDFPRLLYKYAEDGRRAPPRVATPGVTFRWAVGDVQRALTQLTDVADPVDGGFSLARRLRAAGDLVDPRLLRKITTDVMDVEDPLPFWFELRGWSQGRR